MAGCRRNLMTESGFTARVVARAMDRGRPAGSVESAAKVFILDALGTGWCGTRQPYFAGLRAAATGWGQGGSSRVFADHARLPAPSAALLNGYLIHNQEFDNVHEGAIVHPMGVILASLLARADEATMTGAELLTAVCTAVDIAVAIGATPRTPLKFYRQGMAAALGGAAALARLSGLDEAGVRRALGHCYSELSGSMQAHAEGSPALALQMGVNARAVLTAVDLAAAGFPAPAEVLEGRYGYFNLMEEAFPPERLAAADVPAGRVAELSHKPFPTGRATHAAVDALLQLRAEFGIAADAVDAVEVSAPPLVLQLGGRPLIQDMTPNYARLCLPYVAATALLQGGVDVSDFDADALADSRRHSLGAKVSVTQDSNDDHNALAPVTVTLKTTTGESFERTVTTMLGHPDNPLGREAYLDKYRRAAAQGARPLEPERVEAVIATIDRLETIDDVSMLMQLLSDAT